MRPLAVDGTRRALLLGPDAAVRGRPAEYRHAGISIACHADPLHALVDAAHDPGTIVVLASDFSALPLADALDLLLAVCPDSVILGLSDAEAVDAVRVALAAGVRTTVMLPLTPDRLRAAIGRLPHAAAPHVGDEILSVGGLTVDTRSHRVTWRGEPVEVTLREFAVLEALVRSHPHLATLEELAAEYAGRTADPFAAIRVAVSRLRTRLLDPGSNGASPIETVRGVGYRLAC
ncbi:hypothetical protein GCM10022200_28350 [Microbacterium awajiense]|uniref:OmpR/PhoB-type domain-containing protein n=1 Tax=Microbacterium awajiense TaxID=415214 RepID=A0ABP7AYH5_9MICO